MSTVTMTLDGDRRARLDGVAIGGVRLLAASMWIANLHWKVPGDFGQNSGGGLYKYTAAGAKNAPFAPFRWALREIVLPNFHLFGWVTLISETIVGGLLLIGYRTRIVGLVGAALAIVIGLSVVYYPKTDEWSWSYLLMFGLNLLLAAVAAGDHFGVDGLLAEPPHRSARAVRVIGVAGAVVGALGLIVARSRDFAGSKVALLGSDGGFVVDGKLTRRWELKLLFFNPLWALLTIVLAMLLIVAGRRAILAWGAATGFGVLAVVAFIQRTYDYARDDGAIQKISTGTNVAFWGGLAVAAALLTRRAATADGAAVSVAGGADRPR